MRMLRHTVRFTCIALYHFIYSGRPRLPVNPISTVAVPSLMIPVAVTDAATGHGVSRYRLTDRQMSLLNFQILLDVALLDACFDESLFQFLELFL